MPHMPRTYAKDSSKNRYNKWQNFDFARKLREQNKRNILSLHFASMRSVSKPALYIDCICKQYATPCDFTWRKSGTVSRFRAAIKPQSERNKCTRNYVALLVLHRDIYFTQIFLWAGIYVNNNLSSRALSSLYILRGLRISIRKNRRGKIAPSKA